MSATRAACDVPCGGRAASSFNLADQRSRDVLTECTERDMAFVPFCPLGWPSEVRHQILGSPALAVLPERAGRMRITGIR
jgi:hypothetical protein